MKTKIVLNTKHGHFIVNPADNFVGRSLMDYGEYCESEVEFLSQLISKDSIVANIGANIGALTIPLAKLAKKVYAFEPNPHLYHILCGNIAINNLTNVEAYKLGVGEKDGTMYCQDLEKFSSNNGAHSLVSNGDDSFAVHVTPNVPACNVVVMDIEGMEEQALRGMQSMIEACNPFIFVENDHKDKSASLITFLENQLNYKCWWFISPLFNPKNKNENPDNIWGGDVGCFMMICIPNEIPVDFTELIGLQRATAQTWWNGETL